MIARFLLIVKSAPATVLQELLRYDTRLARQNKLLSQRNPAWSSELKMLEASCCKLAVELSQRTDLCLLTL